MIKNDMLVQLLKLQPAAPMLDSMRQNGVVIRRAQPWEISLVREFVLKEFTMGLGR